MEIQTMQTSNSTQIVNIGGFDIGGPNFTVIAGPCSIENQAQFTETATAVKQSGAHLLRGGIWKMRTSAKDFQGLGSDAFDFIKTVCKQTNMTLVSEVTEIRQIEEIYDLVGCFQVGSRSMQNYELLRQLGKQNKPVLLKRGLASYINEWIKAAEYITNGGNPNVVLCERGIRTFETATRNTLDLNAVAYVKQNTSFPVLVDPSHAVGIRALVPQLACASAAVGADGIIVEVHPRPDEALSDGMQSLTLPEFDGMMKNLSKILNVMDRPLHKAANNAD